ncbi:LemA family protein [Ructibacterium gallinarum]|nr:LemA family protein [Ructibacterium gallinarum]
MKMKKGWIIVVCIIAVIVLITIGCVSNYNGLVEEREKIDGLLANIDTQLQRRNDLIPNLVSTVQGYTDHENEVLTHIADARSKLAGAQTTEEKSKADSELSSALSRLLVVVENYPQLKADTQFIALSDELAGTENRIAVARKDYNDAAQQYNAMIKKFPKVIFANLFGFEKAEYFEATEGAEQVPQVSFD